MTTKKGKIKYLQSLNYAANRDLKPNNTGLSKNINF